MTHKKARSRSESENELEGFSLYKGLQRKLMTTQMLEDKKKGCEEQSDAVVMSDVFHTQG